MRSYTIHAQTFCFFYIRVVYIPECLYLGLELTVYLTLPRKGEILLRFFNWSSRESRTSSTCDGLRYSTTQGYLVNQHPTENQPFHCTTFICEVLTVHGNKLRLFMTLTKNVRHLTYQHVGTIFNVFSYDKV